MDFASLAMTCTSFFKEYPVSQLLSGVLNGGRGGNGVQSVMVTKDDNWVESGVCGNKR